MKNRWLGGQGENGLRDALGVFSRGIAERPEFYGVSAEAAARAVQLVAQMEAACFLANSPATRTTLTVAAKREAMNAAMAHCRPLGTFIRMNPSLCELDLMLIGVPPKAEARRHGAPTTAPLLMIRGIVPGGHRVEVFDSTTPAKRVKPDGVRGFELAVAYSPNVAGKDEPLSAATILQTGKSHGEFTRLLSNVTHPNERVGSVANYIARWLNGRKEAGPWSQPVRMHLVLPGEAGLSAAA
jgi:hypothetical protein